MIQERVKTKNHRYLHLYGEELSQSIEKLGCSKNRGEPYPAVPTTCCMSGCANCVWIKYAEELSSVLKTSEEDVQKIILEKVQDSNMRAFLAMELRCRKFNK